jgi:hypothetical protein
VTKVLYAAIDPGKTGALAFIFPSGKVESWHTPTLTTRVKHPRAKTKKGNPKVSVTKVYDTRAMFDLVYRLCWYRDKKGFVIDLSIEGQQSRPTDSKGVVFAVAHGVSKWETIAELCELPYLRLWPHVWKPRYLKKQAPKKASLELARKLFPNHDLPLAKDEARAEALLMADYLRRKRMEIPFLRSPARGRKGKPSGGPTKKSKRSRKSRIVQ